MLLTLGALAAAVLMAPPASTTPTRGLAWLLFVGSSVHVASTGWLYTLPEIRAYAGAHRARYIWAPIGLIALSAAIAATVSPASVAWLLLPYFAWQFFHFQKQNLGMAALTASSLGLTSLRPAERRSVMLAGGAGILGLVAHPALLQLSIAPQFGALFPAARALFVAAVVIGLALLARRAPRHRPREFCAVYASSLLFSLPVFVFRSPYAAVGGMTVAHGLQYLLLIVLVAVGGPRSTRRATRFTTLALLFNIAVIGGAVLSAASHLHNEAVAGRLVFGVYLGAVMAHFVVDAGLWRLRDAFPRRFLSARVPYLVPVAGAAPRRSGCR